MFKNLLRSMAVNPWKSLRVECFQIPAYQLIPNTSIQKKPLMIYRSAFNSQVDARVIESHLSSKGVVDPAWRYTMYNTTHFHSTTHEVLVAFNGKAKLCFGGEENPGKREVVMGKGDVVVVPAGVGHRLLEDLDGGFQMVGSYPRGGKQWDMCYGKQGEEGKVKEIGELKWFEKDPVYGNEGPVLQAERTGFDSDGVLAKEG